MISIAWPSDRASEITPTREGDGTSPRTWIAKILSATAVARMCGETKLTIAELTGPVDANRQSSAVTIAGQYTIGCGAARAASVSGAARSVTTPDTQRYACRDTRSRRSPSQPPTYVPTNPVTTTIAPNRTVACALGMPRARSRNDGVQKARAPMAKVYAAYPRTVRTYGRLRSKVRYAFPLVDACASSTSWLPRGGS